MSSIESFGQRKKDHIKISLDPRSQAPLNQFENIQLQHQPLPELDFSEVRIQDTVFGHQVLSPFFVSSMTLGHEGAKAINETIAEGCRERGWMMGVGSQRRQLTDPTAVFECESLRSRYQDLVLFGNLGLAQVVQGTVRDVQNLVDSLGAQFMVIHANPLQEAIQPEGTPQFRGGREALRRVCEDLSVPVVLKETGTGFSRTAIQALTDIPLGALDVSGMGGTHWGRVEGLRSEASSVSYQVAETFSYWGHSTVESLQSAKEAGLSFPIWASGGIRSGLDGAKAIALGADKVGIAMPVLKSAMEGTKPLVKTMTIYDEELRTAMFCMGCEDLKTLRGDKALWIKK